MSYSENISSILNCPLKLRKEFSTAGEIIVLMLWKDIVFHSEIEWNDNKLF